MTGDPVNAIIHSTQTDLRPDLAKDSFWWSSLGLLGAQTQKTRDEFCANHLLFVFQDRYATVCLGVCLRVYLMCAGGSSEALAMASFLCTASDLLKMATQSSVALFHQLSFRIDVGLRWLP